MFGKAWLGVCLWVIAAGIVAGICRPVPASAESYIPPKVLILNSYHKGYGWTDNIMSGIESVFAQEMPDALLYVEYMDTKRHLPVDLYPTLSGLYAWKYKEIRFDAVIATDDNAVNFLLVYRDKLFSSVPVVFCGINDLEMYQIGPGSRVTGVIEDFDLKSTIDLALRLHPKTRHIVSVSDTTPSSRANVLRLRQLMPQYKDRVKFIELDNYTESDLKQALSVLGDDAIVLHLNFFRDRSGKKFNHRESIALVAEATERPVYGAWDWYLGNGAVGGMMTSGRLQGEVAASLAIQILNGESIENLPVVHKSPNQYMFDYNQLKRHKISLSSLPPDSVIINRPESFYAHYKNYIVAAGVCFVLLAGIVVVLSINILRRKRTESEMAAILHSSPVAIFLLKGNRYISKVNPRATDVFGYTQDELMGRDFSILHINHENFEFFGEAYYPELAVSDVMHVEYQYRRKDGEIIWCLASGKALFPPDLSRGTIWVMEDITERKANEEALRAAREDLETRVMERTAELRTTNERLLKEIREHERAESALKQSEQKYYQNLESIFGSLPDAIVTVDASMRIIEANKAFESMSGKSRQAVMGKELQSVLGKTHKPCLDVLSHTLSTREAVKEHRARCPEDNPRQTVVLSTAPFLDHTGDFAGAVLEIRDISRLVELEHKLQEHAQFRSFVGAGAPMRRVYGTLENLAGYDTTVLILGESGTGKELAAEALHANGASREGPFIKVNCSALSENLLESELFGHVRGAFTGAYKDKIGRFQAAEGGTIFLDEIGDISPAIQLKLLRFLEQREFERVGDARTVKANVRVLAATNVDLQGLVAGGRFREDLYYRLKVMEVRMPPLRERGGDIKLLVEHFVAHYRKTLGKRIDTMDDRAMAVFMRHPWPGNVRELKHAVEHACIVCDSRTISLSHLPSELGAVSNAPLPVQPGPGRDRLSRESVLAALEQTKWNKTRAAEALGISRRHLYRKLDQYGLK